MNNNQRRRGRFDVKKKRSSNSNKRKREQLLMQKSRKRSKTRTRKQEEKDREIQARAAAEGLVPIDRTKLRSRSVMPSWSVPTLAGKYYLDWEFVCKDCGKTEVWTGAQQKWWHEDMAGDIERIAVRCHDCRAKERQRREESRKIHMEGLARRGRDRECD